MHVLEEKEKEKAWDVWLVRLPDMKKENFMTFNEFWKSLHDPRMESRAKTKEEILTDAESILKGRWNDGTF